MIYKDWQLRLKNELDDLLEKIDKLSDFLCDYHHAIMVDELVRLQRQEAYMKLYADILRERWEAIHNETKS